WRSARTASSLLSQTVTTTAPPCGCGTRPPDNPSDPPCPPPPDQAAAWTRWRSARTASSWPPPTTSMAPRYSCGKCRYLPIHTQRSVPTWALSHKKNGLTTPQVRSFQECAYYFQARNYLFHATYNVPF